MEARELRIGNYVYVIAEGHENEPDTFKWGVDDYEFYSDRMHFIKPIPLTEELLLKFGFDKIDYDLYDYQGYDFGYLGRNGENFYTVFQSQQTSKEIKYAHQLQNLYFALTSEELTLKK